MIALSEVRRWGRSLGAERWCPAPEQVEQLLSTVASDDAELCAMLAWTADLMTLGGVSATEQSKRLGVELSALSRMLAESIPGQTEHRKDPKTYWHVVSRGPQAVQLVACARWAIYRKSGQSDRICLSIQAQSFVEQLCDKEPRLREILQRL